MNSYPDWLLKKPNNRSQGDQAPTQETTKETSVSVPYFQGLSEEFRRIFKDTKVQIIFKGCNTLKILLMHPKDKIPTQLCQEVVYQWTCPKKTAILLLENPADTRKAGSKNTISHLPELYSNII